MSQTISARVLQKRVHKFAAEKFFNNMKLAIVGSREFENYDLFCAEVAKIQKKQKIDLIVSGGAKGADTLAKKFAALNQIPLMDFLPDYDRYGRGAPLQRNTLIVKKRRHGACLRHRLFKRHMGHYPKSRICSKTCNYC